MTCSWKMGAPWVRANTSSVPGGGTHAAPGMRRRRLEVGMRHTALDRAGRTIATSNHQVVELGPAGAAACSSAPAIRSGRRRCGVGGRSSRRSPGPRPGCHADGAICARLTEVRACSATRGSTCRAPARRPSAGRRLDVVLVPLDRGALRHRRVLDRHQRASGPREMTKPPTCWDRWRKTDMASCRSAPAI